MTTLYIDAGPASNNIQLSQVALLHRVSETADQRIKWNEMKWNKKHDSVLNWHQTDFILYFAFCYYVHFDMRSVFVCVSISIEFFLFGNYFYLPFTDHLYYTI